MCLHTLVVVVVVVGPGRGYLLCATSSNALSDRSTGVGRHATPPIDRVIVSLCENESDQLWALSAGIWPRGEGGGGRSGECVCGGSLSNLIEWTHTHTHAHLSLEIVASGEIYCTRLTSGGFERG